MSYVRLSGLLAQPGREQEVADLVDRLHMWYRERPGHILALRMVSEENPAEIVRFTIWENRDDADRVALADQTLTIRSALLQIAEEVKPSDVAYHVQDPIPTPLAR